MIDLVPRFSGKLIYITFGLSLAELLGMGLHPRDELHMWLGSA